MAENRVMTALEAEKQENLAFEANHVASENLALKADPVEICDAEQNAQKPVTIWSF